MKKIFTVKLNCPFCKEEIDYNIVSFKAKHECKNCKNDLIVRARPIISTIISMIGFVVVFSVMNALGISSMGKLPRLAFIVVGCLIYLSLAYLICCKIAGPSKLFAVDAQDPTLLKRYKRK